LFLRRERSRKHRLEIHADQRKQTDYLAIKREKEKLRYAERKKDPAFRESRRQGMQHSRCKKKNNINYLPSADQAVTSKVIYEGYDQAQENLGNYKNFSTFSKALIKVRKVLPKCEENQKAVVEHLFYEYHPVLQQRNRPFFPPKDINEEIVNFYNRDDVSQQLPGIRDTRLIRNADGSKQHVQKRVMLLTLTEAYAEFKKMFDEADIGKSTFCALKPLNISCLFV